MCDALGDGSIWYLNPKNYAHRLYRVRGEGEGLNEFRGGGAGATEKRNERSGMLGIMDAAEARANGDMERFNSIMKNVNEHSSHRPSSQVVPLQDAKAIMDIVQGPFGAMMCMCRERFRGEEETNLREYSCMGIGTGMLKWERWPERYKGGVEFMSPSVAKEWLEYWNKRGYVITIMQEGQNFIGGLCLCDYPSCGLIRARLDYGAENILVKAEYVAEIDYTRCTGCGECVKGCQFGALRYEVAKDKANIDPFKCYGCGVCELKCSRKAIKMIKRSSVPALRNVW
jgi:ferredoxin